MIRIRINGVPAPQGSKRFVGTGGSGRGRMVESSKAVGPWREAVRAEAQRVLEDGPAPLLEGPVSLDLQFWLPRPKSHYGKRGLLPSAPLRPHRKPDLDKLLRSSWDGLVAGGAIRDDAQVVSCFVEKYYADDDHAPGLLVTVCKAAHPVPVGVTP